MTGNLEAMLGILSHTPGEWVVDEILSVQAITPCGEVCIADVGGPSSYRDEQRANALVIAAAPKLLAALITIVSHSDEATIVPGHSPAYAFRLTNSDRQMAIAAIARAIGDAA